LAQTLILALGHRAFRRRDEQFSHTAAAFRGGDCIRDGLFGPFDGAGKHQSGEKGVTNVGFYGHHTTSLDVWGCGDKLSIWTNRAILSSDQFTTASFPCILIERFPRSLY
jgi:hypothetical protein